MGTTLSHIEQEAMKSTALKTVLLLLAVALNALELFLPRIPFLPWLKPGLANSITIIWLIRYGLPDTILFTILRTWISGFYFGLSFLTIALSLSGGVLATVAMGLVWKLLGKRSLSGTVGIAITGALFHNLGQLAVVYLMVTRNSSIVYQIPFMTGASILFGSVIGVLVPSFWRIIPDGESIKTISVPQAKELRLLYSAVSIGVLAFCFLLFTVHSLVQLFAAAAIVTVVAMVLRRSWSVLVYPCTFWPLFLFIGFVYLAFSYGTRIGFLPFLTREGVYAASQQIIRVWAWIEAGVVLHRFRFHDLFFRIIEKAFPGHGGTLAAGMIALQYFPDVLRFAKSKESVSGLLFFRKPVYSLCEYLKRMLLFISELQTENK